MTEKVHNKRFSIFSGKPAAKQSTENRLYVTAIVSMRSSQKINHLKPPSTRHALSRWVFLVNSRQREW